MKKLLAILLAFAMCLSLTACGGSQSGQHVPAEETTSDEPEETPTSGGEAEEPAEDDSTVEITLPAEYFSDDITEETDFDTSDDDVDAFANGALSGKYESYKINSDGAVTFTMTKQQHQEALEAVGKVLDQEAAEAFPDEDMPSIKSLSFSDDFTSATFVVDYEAYDNSFDSIAEYVAIFYCQTYHLMSGQPASSLAVEITIQDEESGHTEAVRYYPDDYTVSEETENSENFENTKIANAGISIEPTVLYDDKNIVVTATELSCDDYGNIVLTAEVENNSSSDIDFVLWDWTVNRINLMCATSFTVTAGKTGEVEFSLYGDDLQESSIYQIITLGIHGEIQRESDYDTIDNIDVELALSGVAAGSKPSDPSESLACIYEGNGIKLYYIGVKPSEYEDEDDEVQLLAYSERDSAVNISPENVSFDNTMDYDNFYSFNIYPDTFSLISLYGENLAEVSESQFDLNCWDDVSGNTIFTAKNISIQLG